MDLFLKKMEYLYIFHICAIIYAKYLADGYRKGDRERDRETEADRDRDRQTNREGRFIQLN